jgi:hypothetical protein
MKIDVQKLTRSNLSVKNDNYDGRKAAIIKDWRPRNLVNYAGFNVLRLPSLVEFFKRVKSFVHDSMSFDVMS